MRPCSEINAWHVNYHEPERQGEVKRVAAREMVGNNHLCVQSRPRLVNRSPALLSFWNDAQDMAGFAGVPAAAFEGAQLDAVGDDHAVADFGSGACAVENQRHAVGAAADLADLKHHV